MAPEPTSFYIARVSPALYTRDILRLAASIPHPGRLATADARVERVSPVCGSRVATDVTLDREGRVAALAQEVRACALGQAAASLLGAHAVGRSLEEIEAARDALAAFLAGERDDPGPWPGLAVLAPARPYSVRHASILLSFDAAAEAVERALAAAPAPQAAG